MKNLDDQLRDALRREEPPLGFAERVIAQAGQSRSVEEAIRLKPDPTGSSDPARSLVGSGFSRIGIRWLAAAAVVVAVAGGTMQYRTVQMERARAEQAAGEAARQRVMLALQIAGSKLQLVQARINSRLHEQPGRNSNQPPSQGYGGPPKPGEGG